MLPKNNRLDKNLKPAYNWTMMNKERMMNDKENAYYNEAVEYVADFYDISEDEVIFAYQDEIEAYMKLLRSLDVA
jgi:hypothetical protein